MGTIFYTRTCMGLFLLIIISTIVVIGLSYSNQISVLANLFDHCFSSLLFTTPFLSYRCVSIHWCSISYSFSALHVCINTFMLYFLRPFCPTCVYQYIDNLYQYIDDLFPTSFLSYRCVPIH